MLAFLFGDLLLVCHLAVALDDVVHVVHMIARGEHGIEWVYEWRDVFLSDGRVAYVLW